MTALRVVVDGAALPDEEARAFWKRFSAWMEEHRGDLGGFARAEGLASVCPEMHGTTPVLVASRTASQRPYTSAEKPGLPPPQRARGTDRDPRARGPAKRRVPDRKR